jgi:hypothetical protein
MTIRKKSDYSGNRKVSNFSIQLTSPDFSLEPVNCTRAKLRVDVPVKGRRGRVDSGLAVELIPMANGSLEIRVWLSNKFLLKTIKLVDGLIDWSLVDGRSVNKEDKLKDQLLRKEARRILIPKTRKRKLNVRYAREVGEEQNDNQSEGSLLAEETSDLRQRGSDVSGSGVGQDRTQKGTSTAMGSQAVDVGEDPEG